MAWFTGGRALFACLFKRSRGAVFCAPTMSSLKRSGRDAEICTLESLAMPYRTVHQNLNLKSSSLSSSDLFDFIDFVALLTSQVLPFISISPSSYRTWKVSPSVYAKQQLLGSGSSMYRWTSRRTGRAPFVRGRSLHATICSMSCRRLRGANPSLPPVL